MMLPPASSCKESENICLSPGLQLCGRDCNMVQAPEDYEVRSLLINALLPFLADSVVQQLLLAPNDCWSFIQLYIMQWLSFIPSTFVSHQLDLSLDQLSKRPVHSTLHNWGTHLQCCQCCHIMWVEEGKCKSPSTEKLSVTTREISSIEAKRHRHRNNIRNRG